MEVKEIPINKIKPDPNQPRKSFNQESIKRLAETYKKHGVIVPIHIDSNYQIILGERRWRAAKLARLKRIPCIIKKVSSTYDRLLEQCIEDVHKEDVSLLEKSKAWRRLLREAKNAANFTPDKYNPEDSGVTWLANVLHLSPTYVRNVLELTDPETPKEIVKAIKEEKIAPTDAYEILRAPKQYQSKILREAIKTEVRKRDLIRQKVKLFNEEEEPELVTELDVGILICPKCRKKFRVIHREPRGHKLEEIG
jgi:ParB family chromosome partitioning protein